MHPYHHALSSTKKHGGQYLDYLAIHEWFDETKKHMPDMRHRALRHHAEGIFWCEERFGTILYNTDGKKVLVRAIAEQHIMEDLGWIPTIKDYLTALDDSKITWIYKRGVSKQTLNTLSEDTSDIRFNTNSKTITD